MYVCVCMYVCMYMISPDLSTQFAQITALFLFNETDKFLRRFRILAIRNNCIKYVCMYVYEFYILFTCENLIPDSVSLPDSVPASRSESIQHIQI